MGEFKVLLEGSKVVTVMAVDVFHAFKEAEEQTGLAAIECEEDLI